CAEEVHAAGHLDALEDQRAADSGIPTNQGGPPFVERAARAVELASDLRTRESHRSAGAEPLAEQHVAFDLCAGGPERGATFAAFECSVPAVERAGDSRTSEFHLAVNGDPVAEHHVTADLDAIDIKVSDVDIGDRHVTAFEVAADSRATEVQSAGHADIHAKTHVTFDFGRLQ